MRRLEAVIAVVVAVAIVGLVVFYTAGAKDKYNDSTISGKPITITHDKSHNWWRSCQMMSSVDSMVQTR